MKLAELEEYIESNNLDAYADVHVAPDFEEGLSALLQSHSIGPLKPNMLLFGWPSSSDRAGWFGQHLRLANALGMSQVILCDKGLPKVGKDTQPRIDVWWRGLENGSLMVLLAHLLTNSWEWRQARIRLLHLTHPDEDLDNLRGEIEALMDAARLEGEIVIIQAGDGSFIESIHENSRDADVVFLGFRPPEDDETARTFHAFYAEVTEGLPTTLLINSSGDVDLLS